MKNRFIQMFLVICAVMLMICAVSVWAAAEDANATPTDLAPVEQEESVPETTEPENPESYERFIGYYLPKTVSAIEHYHTLCTLKKLDGEELRIKKQFEDSLALMAEAFENIFNRVSTEGLLDISTDVSALENILKQDGLTDSDFPATAVK